MRDKGEPGDEVPLNGGVAKLVKLLLKQPNRRDEQIKKWLGLICNLVEGARSKRGGVQHPTQLPNNS